MHFIGDLISQEAKNLLFKEEVVFPRLANDIIHSHNLVKSDEKVHIDKCNGCVDTSMISN